MENPQQYSYKGSVIESFSSSNVYFENGNTHLMSDLTDNNHSAEFLRFNDSGNYGKVSECVRKLCTSFGIRETPQICL